MSLECVRKFRTPGVNEKHRRELFNLISNGKSTSFSIPALFPSFACSQSRLVKIDPQRKKSLKSHKLLKSAVSLETGSWGWTQHILTSCFLPSLSPTGQQRENWRDYCSVHALQQNFCRVSVCAADAQSHNFVIFLLLRISTHGTHERLPMRLEGHRFKNISNMTYCNFKSSLIYGIPIHTFMD